MKIYADTIGLFEIRDAIADAQLEAAGAWIDHDTHTLSHKGRRRAMTHNVQLIGTAGRHTRRRNTGQRGADAGDFAATWMDWGWFIAVMFRFEPTAVIGQYDGQADFLDQTRRMIPTKLGRHGDPSVKNFAMRHASWWPNPFSEAALFAGETPTGIYAPENVTSPFTLVDRVCPPRHLIALRPAAALEAWLESA